MQKHILITPLALITVFIFHSMPNANAEHITSQTTQKIPWIKPAIELTANTNTSQKIQRIPWIKSADIPEIRTPVVVKNFLDLKKDKSIAKTLIPADKNLFNQAFKKLMSGQYKKAINDYLLIFNKYPQSRYTADSHYRIAEAIYLSGDYQSAISKYIFVLTNFPQNTNAIYAELRIGQSYQQMRNWPRAQQSFKHIIKKYPNSITTQLAQEHIVAMRNKGFL